MIVTEYIRPPVPSTMYDWMAFVRGDEEGPTGYGQTEAEALRDLCEKLVELVYAGQYAREQIETARSIEHNGDDR